MESLRSGITLKVPSIPKGSNTNISSIGVVS